MSFIMRHGIIVVCLITGIVQPKNENSVIVVLFCLYSETKSFWEKTVERFWKLPIFVFLRKKESTNLKQYEGDLTTFGG